jgi:Carboxypeptidase regulatory-like domain/Ankyrin repeats (3 copies)/Ankyrin repeats (many copies)
MVMKNRSLVDSIEVKSPCSQSWDSMQGNDEVRFCDHCVKHVHDLSAITRKDVRKLIARSRGGLCVRYVRRPDGRIETLKRTLHQLTRQTGIAAGVLGTSLAASTLAYAQTVDTSLPQQETPQAELSIEKDTTPGGISGVVTDQNGAVITFAVVTVFNDTGSVYQSLVTNAEGYYEFRGLPDGKYKLKVDAGGFQSREMDEVTVSPEILNKYDVQMAVSQVAANVDVGGRGGEGYATGGVVEMSHFENVTSNKLIRAVQADDLEEVKALIGQGKKVNVKNGYDEGNFPLHYAVENGNFDIVQTLLYAGAKISVKNYDKKTPIMMLDSDASPDLVNLMLRFGAQLSALDKDKNTPLLLAAADASEAVVRVLILNGADLNAQNKKGRTALMLAAEAGNMENVKALLESGANANMQSKKGETAWSMTSAEDIRQVLISYGGMAQQQ